jgi:hypothetical protein
MRLSQKNSGRFWLFYLKKLQLSENGYEENDQNNLKK